MRGNRENRMGGFRKGGFSNNRFVLKPDVAIASEVSILSKISLAITDFHAKKTQHVQLFENPLPGTPPFAISKGKLTENCPQTLFFLGNSMTIKFGNFANFIVRKVVVIWEAPTQENQPRKRCQNSVARKCIQTLNT